MGFVLSSRVHFVDTDASGRIHYTAMLKHFEYAEQEFFRSLGLRYAEPHALGYGFPRVHVECDYTAFVAYDDLLTIAVVVERIGRTSFTLAFDATVEGRQVAHGKIVIVCVDVASRQSRPFPTDFLALLNQGKAASN
jgi:YbgC/YbaW family acyl-CoA thioester hydrolase